MATKLNVFHLKILMTLQFSKWPSLDRRWGETWRNAKCVKFIFDHAIIIAAHFDITEEEFRHRHQNLASVTTYRANFSIPSSLWKRSRKAQMNCDIISQRIHSIEYGKKITFSSQPSPICAYRLALKLPWQPIGNGGNSLSWQVLGRER